MDSHELFVLNKFKIIGKLILANSKVLDIGCHKGGLRSFLKNPTYFGVDVDREEINKLKSKKISAKFVDLNKEEIPFKGERFDYIFLLDILEHLVNPRAMMEQVKSRLNKNGKIIITLPNDYHFLNKLRFIFNKPLTENPFAPYGHLHYFPINLGEKFLLESGFKISKKIILPPVKPQIIPKKIKIFLAKTFPQNFARDILYELIRE